MAVRQAIVAPLPQPAKVESDVEFFSSGSTLLDLALGGGWAVGRVGNIVGDRSVGKTLVGYEAFANFEMSYPDKPMRYAESEAASDGEYAHKVGLPRAVEFPDSNLETIEEFNDDLVRFIGSEGPSLYILDSLDALSDEAEMAKAHEMSSESSDDEEEGSGKKKKGSYGTQKAKKLSQFFRSQIRDIERNDTTLLIISQIRDNIGVTFGDSYVRAGGRALDFYASQIVYLAHLKKLEREVRGQKRAIGVEVEAYVKKLKVGNPFRRARFSIMFGYGIDDEKSMLDWLRQTKEIGTAQAEDWTKELISYRASQDRIAISQLCGELQELTRGVWAEIEAKLEPPMRKYQ